MLKEEFNLLNILDKIINASLLLQIVVSEISLW